ncbi:hypothetical protein ACIPUD_31190 [Bradyrhizobium sp. CAR08]|uniref:hypothetical protein n=1 Tax=unclassified Bradyrhizobium TaxID=2631580 RepID=UPI00366F6B7B
MIGEESPHSVCKTLIMSSMLNEFISAIRTPPSTSHASHGSTQSRVQHLQYRTRNPVPAALAAFQAPVVVTGALLEA